MLLVTTTFPIVYLLWNSLQTINLAMPCIDGFAALANYAQMLADRRFWHSLRLTAIYTGATVVMQLAIGLGLALLVLQNPARPVAVPASSRSCRSCSRRWSSASSGAR